MVINKLSLRTFALAGVVLCNLLLVSPVYAAGFGNCKVLLVGKKPPTISNDKITPLCAEDADAVFFATGYSKKTNHGAWSAYRLGPDQVRQIKDLNLPRPNQKFAQLPKLNVPGYVQPRHDSYTGTNFDRGHLAPNGAMAWDADAQKKSFTIANIAPQKPAMNRNIWRCFETSIREWAEEFGDSFVVVGTFGNLKTISSDRDINQVPLTVPSHFIAMVFRAGENPKAVGVMVPNESGNLDVRQFMMSVDELEQKTGYGFNLPTAVSKVKPDLKFWPTRLVTKEILGELPPIDEQCPRVNPVN